MTANETCARTESATTQIERRTVRTETKGA